MGINKNYLYEVPYILYKFSYSFIKYIEWNNHK